MGKKNRADADDIMMGRKGIGKLAAFYLSNKYYVVTKTETEDNIYEIDFTGYENGTIQEDDNNHQYINKVNNLNFTYKYIYESLNSGTAIVMNNVSFVSSFQSLYLFLVLH